MSCGFTKVDLQNIVNIIEVCTKRGAFQAEEMTGVGQLYDKLKIGPKLRKTHRNKTVHKETLDNESIQILESIYKNDIEPLNYISKLK